MGINEDKILLFVILTLINVGAVRYTTFFFLAVIRCSYHVSQLVEFQMQIDT